MNSQIIYNYMLGPTRNLLLGAGLCYAWKKEQYAHLPAIILFPSVYAGYHLYENKEQIIRFAREFKNQV
jgi:hypothetical protein